MEPNGDSYITIYRPYITKPDGSRVWAKWFGKKAFPIRVRRADLPGRPTNL